MPSPLPKTPFRQAVQGALKAQYGLETSLPRSWDEWKERASFELPSFSDVVEFAKSAPSQIGQALTYDPVGLARDVSGLAIGLNPETGNIDPWAALGHGLKIGGLDFKGPKGYDEMQKALFQYEDEIRKIPNPNRAEAAVKLADIIHPEEMKVPGQIKIEEFAPYDIWGNQKGVYHWPGRDEVVIYNQNNQNKLKNLIGYLLHEAEHADQAKIQGRYQEAFPKGQPAFRWNPATQNMEPIMEPAPGGLPGQQMQSLGKYVTGTPTQAELDALPTPEAKQALIDQRYQEYVNQPLEKEAFAKQAEVESNFQVLENALRPKDVKPFDLTQPITRENFKDFLQDFIFKGYKQKLAEIADNPILANNPEHLKRVKDNFKYVLKKIAEGVTNPRSGPFPIERVHDILRRSDFADFLKQQGYTSIQGKYVKPKHLIPMDIEDLLNLPGPRKY